MKLLKKLFFSSIALAIIAFCFINAFTPQEVKADDAWWNSSFQKRLKLTFDNSARGDLNNFPIAVKLDSGRINYSDFVAG